MILTVPIMALIGVIGLGICRVSAVEAHRNELLIAAAIGIVSALGAQLAILLMSTVGEPSIDASQAGLAGLVVLMLATVALAAMVTLVGWVGADQRKPFVLWLLVFAWASLAEVSWVAIYTIRSAARQQRPQQQSSPSTGND
jgi:hypothetical protein